MTTAATKNCQPPMYVMVLKTAMTLRIYVTVRPKLSARLLSIPG
jgi:hypothetical protein